ncbi:nuclear transport factor 2 family protein [Lacunimicrobium album]
MPKNDPLDRDSLNYDGLMRANLVRVFGERDPDQRLRAIRELYTEGAVINEPHASAKGHAAINDAVSSLLKGLPPNIVFSPIGPAIGHHRVGRLKWRSGLIDGPPIVTGMDIAHFDGHRIHSLFVFLDSDNG